MSDAMGPSSAPAMRMVQPDFPSWSGARQRPWRNSRMTPMRGALVVVANISFARRMGENRRICGLQRNRRGRR